MDRTLDLLVEHCESLPVPEIVQQLDTFPTFLYRYLCVWEVVGWICAYIKIRVDYPLHLRCFAIPLFRWRFGVAVRLLGCYYLPLFFVCFGTRRSVSFVSPSLSAHQ